MQRYIYMKVVMFCPIVGASQSSIGEWRVHSGRFVLLSTGDDLCHAHRNHWCVTTSISHYCNYCVVLILRPICLGWACLSMSGVSMSQYVWGEHVSVCLGWTCLSMSGVSMSQYVWSEHVSVCLGWTCLSMSGVNMSQSVWGEHVSVCLGWACLSMSGVNMSQYVWGEHVSVCLGWTCLSMSGVNMSRYV